MKKLLLLSGCLLQLTVGVGQDLKNEWSLSVGRQTAATLDWQASPLLYRAEAVAGGLTYRRLGEKHRVQVRLAPALGTNVPKRYGSRGYGQPPYAYEVTSAWYTLDLQVGYLRKVGKQRGPLRVFVGAELGNSLMIADKMASFYWGTNILALNAQTQAELRQGRYTLTAKLSAPVVAAVTRHIYANFPKSTDGGNFEEFFRQGTHLSGPDKLQRLEAEAQCAYRLSRRMGLGVGYRFSWFRYPSPRPIRSYTQNLTLGTSFQF